ncbi:hypothetical protein BC830DRAFT_582013 [Chytriomyces sp. MP71]|nr:hypothetical protein BC830DRAFT_582013 [Chytriomyces sp. MP71]
MDGASRPLGSTLQCAQRARRCGQKRWKLLFEAAQPTPGIPSEPESSACIPSAAAASTVPDPQQRWRGAHRRQCAVHCGARGRYRGGARGDVLSLEQQRGRQRTAEFCAWNGIGIVVVLQRCWQPSAPGRRGQRLCPRSRALLAMVFPRSLQNVRIHSSKDA